ncbi:MAG TPA: alpha/beta fold hydrolase [Magnetospirillum sp.]|jgi:sigma-B regulation protein RsbQ|nr:alpha/beta fold hydrolase [Magnetospirillum sp.]
MLTHDLLARVRDLPKWHRITVSGKGSQTVVLANGFGTDQTFWRGLLPWLEERFRVVRFDWLIDPDHFDSSRYKSLEGFAEDLLAIQMATDAAPCLYVGQSMGAMVGMLAARRRPDFFRSMVMLAPSPCFINHPGYRGGFDQEGIDALLGQIGHDYMEWVKSFSPLVVAAPPSHQDAQEFARCLMALRPDVALSMALTVFKMDLRNSLDGFQTPVTIVQTKHDIAVPMDVAQYLHDRWPQSRLEVIEAEGHVPQLTAPQEVTRVMETAFAGY